jgi:hypothetical protein
MPKLTQKELDSLHGESPLFAIYLYRGDFVLQTVKVKRVRKEPCLGLFHKGGLLSVEYYLDKGEATDRRTELVLNWLKRQFQTLVNKAQRACVSREQLFEILKEEKA